MKLIKKGDKKRRKKKKMKKKGQEGKIKMKTKKIKLTHLLVRKLNKNNIKV